MMNNPLYDAIVSSPLSNKIECMCITLDNAGSRDFILPNLLYIARKYALDESDDYMTIFAYAKKYRELGCERFLQRIRLGMLWDEEP